MNIKKIRNKFTIYGILLGLIFPITAISIRVLTGNVIYPFFSIILIAPLVLGKVFRVLGKTLEEKNRNIIKINKTIQSFQDSEEKFTAIYNLTDDAMLMFDKNGIFSCNDSTLFMYGIADKEDLFKLHIHDLAPKQVSSEKEDEVKEFFDEAILETESKGTNLIETMQIRLNTKALFPAEITMISFELRGINIIQARIKDISERKAEEAELAQKERQLKKILNNIAIGVIIIEEKTHKIVFSNPAAAIMTKLSMSELIGRSCFNYICPANEGSCPYTDLGKEIENSEERLIRKDLGQIDVLKTIKEIEYDGKKCLLETVVDISKLKEADLKKKEYLKELQKSKEKLNLTLDDVARANRLMYAREGRILEVKSEVNSLLKELGRKEKYRATI